MTKEEIENYFVESAGYGRDKVRNFMDIVNKALKQKGERITELEKENAKLKTDYEVLNCSVGDFGELQDKLEEEQRKNNGLSDNLTKAKEIIKLLLHALKNEGSDYTFALENTHPALAEAEKFIKDSEVEK